MRINEKMERESVRERERERESKRKRTQETEGEIHCGLRPVFSAE